MGRGPAKDRLTDDFAVVVRSVVRTVRDSKGLTNEDLAGLVGWTEGRLVRDALAANRALRQDVAITLLRAVKKAKPGNRRPPKGIARWTHLISDIDTVLAAIENAHRIPPALIPKWEVRSVADYLAYVISQVEDGIGPQRRKTYADLLRRVLERAAEPMAHQFYQYFRGQWIDGCPADRLLRQYGLPHDDEFLSYKIGDRK
jgi:hypothetical protein